ncbi:MAG: lipopolysaccharide biosynthesis protein [Bacteroidales bacterium]|nr:lipopolysaccharide biosynthesis protein [Bacteroidales bacterium]
MKLNSREYIRISVIYTAVAAFPPLLNLVIRPLIEGFDRLDPADFSRIEIAEVITSLAFVIAIYSMGNAISRFYYDYLDDRKGYRQMVSGIFNSILVRGAFVLLAAWIFMKPIGRLFTQPELQDFGSYGFAAILTGISRAVNLTAFALYRNEKKVRLYLLLNFMLGGLRAGFQLAGVFLYDMSFTGYVYGTAVGSGFTSLTILGYTYATSGFKLNHHLLKPVHQFARPLSQYALILWAIRFADRYFLESTPNELGIYSQALMLSFGIEVILQGLQGATQPEIFRMMKEGTQQNIEGIKKLSNLLMAQSQVLIALTILPAMLYCQIFKTDLRLAAGFISIVFVRYIQRTQYVIFSFPVYYEKKTKFYLYLNSFSLAINLLLLYFLVPIWGAYGAVTGILASQAFMVAGVYWYQNRIIQIPWNLRKLMVFPTLILVLSIILELVKLQMNSEPFLPSSVLVAAIFAGQAFLYRKELREIIKGKWSQYF